MLKFILQGFNSPGLYAGKIKVEINATFQVLTAVLLEFQVMKFLMCFLWVILSLRAENYRFPGS
jgi:hypothetical protein